MMKTYETLIKAKLLALGNNRFNYKIMINNNIFDCYVASTAHLSNYINIENIECLVKPNTPKSKYPYTLISIKQKNIYSIVNFNIISQIFKEFIYTNGILEKRLSPNYKADLFISEENKLIELKAVLSKNNHVNYPDETSLRFEKQLNSIFELLQKGCSAELIFILLNKKISNIIIQNEYKNILNKCIANGLKLKTYYMHINKNYNLILKNSSTIKIII